MNRTRILTIVILLGGTVSLCAAAESGNSMNRQPDPGSGGIRDPLNPQAYMRELAGRLDPATNSNMLLKGVDSQKAAPSAAKSTPRKPAENPSSKPTASQGPQGGFWSMKTHATAAAPQQPVNAKSTMLLWNGLSPDNRAAQRALEDIYGRGPEVAQATTEPAEGPRVSSPSAGQPAPTAFWPTDSQGRTTAQQTPAGTKPAVDVADELTSTNPTRQQVANVLNGQNQDLPGPIEGLAASSRFNGQGSGSLTRQLMTSKTGVVLWKEPTAGGPAAPIAPALLPVKQDNPATAQAPANAPWALGPDLEKYRAHAVKEGSRDTGESLKKAFQRAGLTLEDGANVFLLGYASDRGEEFRANDGKGLLDDPGKAPRQAGTTLVNFGDGLYSLADLVTLDSLPNPAKEPYQDNNLIVRPLVFTGRTIGGVWKTTEEVGNALTWGYFDNVTGCIGKCIEDILELFKHTGQAVTNLVRLPMHAVGGKNEGADRTMDWVLLVPLEFVSNSVEMKGISNMQDYKNAFADKGVIGSVLEFGGSTFLVYRAVDKLADDLKDNNNHGKHQHASGETSDDGFYHYDDPPIDEPVPPPADVIFYYEGDWPGLPVPEPAAP
jgi:hypothetical protein